MNPLLLRTSNRPAYKVRGIVRFKPDAWAQFLLSSTACSVSFFIMFIAVRSDGLEKKSPLLMFVDTAASRGHEGLLLKLLRTIMCQIAARKASCSAAANMA